MLFLKSWPKSCYAWLSAAIFFSHICETDAQLTPWEWEPLVDGLNHPPALGLNERVPLMTNDTVKIPLIDLQVFAPPGASRQNTNTCSVLLLEHSFGVNSFGVPAVVDYVPPTAPECGQAGEWLEISLNLTVYCIGTQYDRLGSIYLSHVEIWRTSSAEPTKTGTVWTTLKDVTHFSPLFAQAGDLMMDFSNIIAPELLLDGVFNVTLTATFIPFPAGSQKPLAADVIIPLSNLSPTSPNLFTIEDDAGATTNVTVPDDTTEAYVEIFASGNSAEEFWYSNTPDEFVSLFPKVTGLIGKGPFREVRLLIDGQLAGVVWPYGVIYTGGITPTNWRPLTSFGAYDAPTYWIDITPFLPLLLSSEAPHSMTLAVRGQGQNPSFNSNWFVSGSIHVRRGTSKTSGRLLKYHAPEPEIRTIGGVERGNRTVWTRVDVRRAILVESELHTSDGLKVVTFKQDLQFINTAQYEDDGWLQGSREWVNQTSNGTTSSVHGGAGRLRDAFIYPLNIFSNYSNFLALFGGYESEVNQTYTRALQPPTDIYRSIHSQQYARGSVEMDNWPGLRHAIMGKGQTAQQFAYIDTRGETYFRDIAAKNDGWIRDEVWGSLRKVNPPVPRSQLYGPDGGPGFR
ncbi:Peptide-N4-(N-acetyl-beta-glucosaminyl)asparagine amidase A [Leucoagaricus sp. SymC.cos]|nr:Peptide-N4-(N-acetyl-beta-glucosaminyl)asparagine amidase A [Leucoagaricus sp. SymC.cos]